MTGRIDSWLGTVWPLGAWLGTVELATEIGLVIADKTTSITVIRNGVTQSAQTVRLETLGGDRQVQGPGGITHNINALVIGYKNHPSISDTSLQVGDRFAVGGVLYEVVMLMPGLTESVQALCTVRG